MDRTLKMEGVEKEAQERTIEAHLYKLSEAHGQVQILSDPTLPQIHPQNQRKDQRSREGEPDPPRNHAPQRIRQDQQDQRTLRQNSDHRIRRTPEALE